MSWDDILNYQKCGSSSGKGGSGHLNISNYDEYLMECLSPKNTTVIKRNFKRYCSVSPISTKIWDALALHKLKSARESFEELEMLKSIEKQHRLKKARKVRANEDIDPPEDDDVSSIPEPTTRQTPEVDEFLLGDIINRLPIPLDSYNEAQKLNPISKEKFGKPFLVDRGNIYSADSIARLPTLNFGSIGEYLVDNLPNSRVKCKGTVITWITNDKQQFRNRQYISRRFLSKLLKYWSYAIDLGHTSKTGNYRDAINMWSVSILNEKRTKTYQMLNGKMAIAMIKDLLFLLRNKPLDTRVISGNLYNIIRAKSSVNHQTFEEILQDIKSRMYHNRQRGEHIWSFPSISAEYLVGLLKELSSREYDLDILYPVIYDLKKYPVETKDTQVRQMSEAQHEQNLSDYDISQYIWERE